jgi:hypothetical protein
MKSNLLPSLFFIPSYNMNYTVPGTKHDLDFDLLPEDWRCYSGYIEVRDANALASLQTAMAELHEILQRPLGDDDFFDYVPDFINQILALASTQGIQVWNDIVGRITHLTEQHFRIYPSDCQKEFEDSIGTDQTRNMTLWHLATFSMMLKHNQEAIIK